MIEKIGIYYLRKKIQLESTKRLNANALKKS
jgi:hypothetical protein